MTPWGSRSRTAGARVGPSRAGSVRVHRRTITRRFGQVARRLFFAVGHGSLLPVMQQVARPTPLEQLPSQLTARHGPKVDPIF
jgi:hypothetical protein